MIFMVVKSNALIEYIEYYYVFFRSEKAIIFAVKLSITFRIHFVAAIAF